MIFYFLKAISYKIKARGGFSLLEAVIYIAILSMLFVVVVHTTIVAANAFGKSRVKRALAAESFTAMERILYEIRFAQNVDQPQSSFGVTPGVLTLNTRVSPSLDTPTTVTFRVNNGVLEIKKGGGTPLPLSGGVSIQRLVFYLLENPGTPSAIRVEMTTEDSFKSLTDTRKFYGTAVLRGGY